MKPQSIEQWAKDNFDPAWRGPTLAEAAAMNSIRPTGNDKAVQVGQTKLFTKFTNALLGTMLREEFGWRRFFYIIWWKLKLNKY